jgi:hypothetical protein
MRRRKGSKTLHNWFNAYLYTFPYSPLLFPSCSRILLFPLLSSPYGLNKVVLDPSCTWIRCTRVSSWYSNGPFNSDLVETFKSNAFNASFNVFGLDRVIGPLWICNGSWCFWAGPHHICSKIIDCVFLLVLYVNSLFMKHISVV